MPILKELLDLVSKSELDSQVKQICDQIMIEEKPKFKYPELEPKGSNMFLSIEYLENKNISYLCLEREAKEKYIVSVWTNKISLKPKNLKRATVWEVTDNKVEKIIKFYAEKFKFVRGES